MKIKVNETTHELKSGSSISDLIDLLDLKPQGIAIAIEETVIPKEQWEETILEDNTELLLIHAFSGG